MTGRQKLSLISAENGLMMDGYHILLS